MDKARNSTKRSFITSLISLVVCITMLLGTTFAWFTDTASSKGNKIVAGKLDVQLFMSNADGNYIDISQNASPIFGTGSIAQNNNSETLWEPGKTQVAYLAIKNNGNLALKYKVALDVTNVSKDMHEAMEYAIIPDAQPTNPVNSWNSGSSVSEGTQTVSGDVSLPVGGTHYFALAVHMKEEAGNEYQGGEVDFDLTVLATQDTVESDSFDEQYDAGAEYAISASTSDELAAALASGKDVVLTAAVQMPDAIEISGDVIIYGTEEGKLLAPDTDNRVINVNHNTKPVTLTLSNVDVVGPENGTYTRGVSVYANTDVTIVADNSSISASYYALNIAGNNDNVDVVTKNSTLTGWCAFQTWSPGTKATFENCTLIGNNDKTYDADGWNDFATIVINKDTNNTDLTFKNCRIEANQTTGNKQYLLDVRAANSKVTLDNCTYFADGNEIEDLGNYISLYPVASNLVLTIDGEIIPIG